MSLEQDFEKFKRRFVDNMEVAGVVLKNKMTEIVAKKTGNLQSSIVVDRPKILGNVVEIEVGSEDVHYAIYVEKGVLGRVYRYHRDGKVVWVGVGMQWAERSLEESLDRISSILRSTKI
jgi:hypothetical protein